MGLSTRDKFLLPVLALLTPFLLIQATDRALRSSYPTSSEHLGRCLDYAGATAGIPGIPNCAVSDKLYETPLIHYRFNACGMNSVAGCHASKPGTFRIALLGSSIAFGQWVEFDDSMAHQIEIDTAQATGRRIEVANYARMEEIPPLAVRLLPDVLAKKPSVVLLAVSPYDIGVSDTNPARAMQITRSMKENHLHWWIDYLRGLLATSSPSQLADVFLTHVKNRFEGTRAATLLLTLDYQNKQQYIRQYLKGQDSEVGYLPVSSSAVWEKEYLAFGRSIQQMAAMTHQAGVPFVVVLLPTRAQVAMLNSGSWPSAYDPYKIDAKVAAIVRSDGGMFLDVFPGCADTPDLEKHFFIQNGHPDGVAHTFFARLIAEQLTSGVIPELKAKSTTGAAH